jgi:hypothetical protein
MADLETWTVLDAALLIRPSKKLVLRQCYILTDGAVLAVLPDDKLTLEGGDSASMTLRGLRPVLSDNHRKLCVDHTVMKTDCESMAFSGIDASLVLGR